LEPPFEIKKPFKEAENLRRAINDSTRSGLILDYDNGRSYHPPAFPFQTPERTKA
jgi:hypothetical protein